MKARAPSLGGMRKTSEATPGRNRWRSGTLRIGSRRGADLDDRLKELMQELGQAINESLSDSERIATAIGEIKRGGYDVFLVLEATIGFNKREDGEEGGDIDLGMPETEEAASPAPETKPKRPRRVFDSTGKVKWTSQDTKFLKALKISLEEEKTGN